MDEHASGQPTPRKRRRRKKTKFQIFKEAYLPYLIMLVAAILMVTFIVGSLRRSGGFESSGSAVSADQLLEQEAATLAAQASELARHYDYEGAMAVLARYTGGLSNNDTLQSQYSEYAQTLSSLVVWDDISEIPNLSFRSLIVDHTRAFADSTYGTRYQQNYITTAEFQALLQDLYDNGYVLVSIYDVVAPVSGAEGSTTMVRAGVRLPEGKKPIILTQEGANFFTYMVDGDGDGLADAQGDGFASRLVLDAAGKLTCEYIQADGTTVTGAYDLIPILNDFVAQHPDFSYKGAKAIISLCGYDGLFGYRTDPETAVKISQAHYQSELAAVAAIVDAVRADGFDLACFTYGLETYSQLGSSEIKNDLKLWAQEAAPILGQVDILVYPNTGDIGDYTGAKYDVLKDFGFRYFIGMDNEHGGGEQNSAYVRQERRWITGSDLKEHPEWYSSLFSATRILAAGRDAVSE